MINSDGLKCSDSCIHSSLNTGIYLDKHKSTISKIHICKPFSCSLYQMAVLYCQQPTKTVNLSAFSVLLLNGKVIIAAVIQFLVLGRGDLDLVGCTVNKG